MKIIFEWRDGYGKIVGGASHFIFPDDLTDPRKEREFQRILREKDYFNLTYSVRTE